MVHEVNELLKRVVVHPIRASQPSSAGLPDVSFVNVQHIALVYGLLEELRLRSKNYLMAWVFVRTLVNDHVRLALVFVESLEAVVDWMAFGDDQILQNLLCLKLTLIN